MTSSTWQRSGAAFEYRNTSVDLNIRAHFAQLVYILKAVIVNALGYDARSVCHAHQHAHLRLHIRREAGIRQSLYICLAQVAVALYEHGILILLNNRSCLAQLCRDTLKMLGYNVFNKNLASSSRRCHHICSGLNLVGNDGIAAAVQTLNSVDLDSENRCRCLEAIRRRTDGKPVLLVTHDGGEDLLSCDGEVALLACT